jgi:SAM-dependent methyltransferase
MEDARYDEVIAHYYDAGYAALPSLGADVDFYRGLAAAAAGPVLELGCGTGRVLARIAEDGHACTGLDASPGMLARLRARAPGVRAVEGDMRDFSLGGRFALVYSAFRAFQHLDAVEDQLRCLACVRAHLAPGARFAFDVFNPRLDLLSSDDESEAEDLRWCATHAASSWTAPTSGCGWRSATSAAPAGAWSATSMPRSRCAGSSATSCST